MWFFTFSNQCVKLSDWLRHRKRNKPGGKSSKGESKVAEVLNNLNLSYETQYPLGYYIHADFAVKANGQLHLIEYNGRQHYAHVKHFGSWWTYFLQRLRDKTEQWECKDRGIPLLNIRYDVPFSEIETVVRDFLLPSQAPTASYPVIIAPQNGAAAPNQCITKLTNKSCRRGASELIALTRLLKEGFNNIREDVVVNINNHKYEPDFVWIGPNFCVDIEIDEPYTTTGPPTHYVQANGKSHDAARDQAFQSAGWYVARFSEEQFFCQPTACLKAICEQLLNDNSISQIPTNLAQVDDLHIAPRWTYAQSLRMAHMRHRQHYLGFEPGHLNVRGLCQMFILTMPILRLSMRNNKVKKLFLQQLKRYFIGTLGLK